MTPTSDETIRFVVGALTTKLHETEQKNAHLEHRVTVLTMELSRSEEKRERLEAELAGKPWKHACRGCGIDLDQFDDKCEACRSRRSKRGKRNVAVRLEAVS